MPLARCPECNNPLSREEQSAGVCPACGKAVPASAAPKLRGEERSSSDLPSRSPGFYAQHTSSGAGPPQWRKVNTGLKIFRLGVIAFFSAVVGALCLAGLLTFGGKIRIDPGVFDLFEACFVGLPGVVGCILGLIGLTLCCLGPKEAKDEWFALAALLGYILSAAIPIASPALLTRFKVTVDFYEILPFLTFATFIISTSLFVFFLRGLARVFGKEKLVSSANRYLIFEAAYLFFLVLLNLLPRWIKSRENARPALPPEARPPWLPEFASIFLAIFFLAMMVSCVGIHFLWFLRLVRRTRDMIGEAA